MFHEVYKLHQSTEQAGKESSQSITDESYDNLEALLQKQKEYVNYLKNGGTSGISAEFGKPILLISEAVPANRRHSPEKNEGSDETLVRKPLKPPDLAEERNQLVRIAQSRMSRTDFERLEGNMTKFESRLAGDKLNAENSTEIARTYREVSRILETRGEQPFKAADRLAIAQQVIQQAADATSIDQGKHATCNVATLECRIYSLNPSEAARLVADVVVHGEYHTHSGKLVQPAANSLKPDWEAKNNPPRDGDRSYASQIFQVTAVNIYHVNETGGQIRYEQRTPDANIPGDSGERLIDTYQGPDAALVNEQGKIIQAPRVPLDALPRISAEIIGKFERDLLLVPANRSENPSWTRIESAQHLERILKELSSNRTLPVVLPVWNNNEPLLKDCGGGAPRGDQGQHVITIVGFDDTTGKWKIDNQFGRKSDRSFTIDELYALTQSAYTTEKIEALQGEVDRNRQQNKIDTYKELELIRTHWGTGVIKNELDLEAALTRARIEAEHRWRRQKDDGTYNPSDEERARQKLADIAQVLPKLLEMRVTGKTTFIGR